MRRALIFLFFFLTLLPVLPSVARAADSDAAIYSRKWMLIYMDGTPPAKEARAGMMIEEDGRLNGTGGCNTFVGVAKISLMHKTIFIGQLTSTMKGCADDVMAQEIGFTTALEKANLWEVEENKLHLKDEAGALLLSFMADPVDKAEEKKEEAAALPAIIGPEWLVEDIRKRGIIDRSHMTMQLTDDGRISGNAGCNLFFGQASIGAGTIETGAMSYTRRACFGEALQKQESQYLRALDSARKWEIRADGFLYMTDSNGNEILRFSRKSAPKK